MYTPAHSDLIALVLAAAATVSLLALVQSTAIEAIGVPAFLAVPLVPLGAACVSGPAHSKRSRFLHRGTVGIAGMAGGILAFAAFDDPYDIGRAGLVIFGAIWAFAFSALAFVIVLAASMLLQPADSNPHG